MNYHSSNSRHSERFQYDYEIDNNSCQTYSQTPTSYATSPASSVYPDSEYGNQPHFDQTYYTSTITFVEAPIYASEISIDDEQSESRIVDAEYQERVCSRDNENSSAENRTPATRQRDPPSIRRWSLENAPEERIRIGLPRWESEQHRAEYQQGNMHEHSNGYEHNRAGSRSRRQERGRRHENRRR